MSTSYARPDHKNEVATTGTVLIRVVHGELIKLHSLRSTTYALAVSVVGILGTAAYTAVGVLARHGTETGDAGTPFVDPTGGALTGVSIAFFAVTTLGVLAVTGEYATGTIKSTMVAVPRRPRLVLGKALAVASWALPMMISATVIAFFMARALLASGEIAVSFTTPGVARAVIGAGFYLTGLTVLGTGFGWLLRSTAGALSALFVLLMVVPTAGLLLPRPIPEKVLPYLPDNAGQAIMATTASTGQLGPWTGFTVFLVWIVVILAGAAILVRRRDA